MQVDVVEVFVEVLEEEDLASGIRIGSRAHQRIEDREVATRKHAAGLALAVELFEGGLLLRTGVTQALSEERVLQRLQALRAQLGQVEAHGRPGFRRDAGVRGCE